jgi:hypothetical protein
MSEEILRAESAYTVVVTQPLLDEQTVRELRAQLHRLQLILCVLTTVIMALRQQKAEQDEGVRAEQARLRPAERRDRSTSKRFWTRSLHATRIPTNLASRAGLGLSNPSRLRIESHDPEPFHAVTSRSSGPAAARSRSRPCVDQHGDPRVRALRETGTARGRRRTHAVSLAPFSIAR